MSIIDKIRKDAVRIVSDANGFGVSLTIISPANFAVEIIGLAKNHRTQYGEFGNIVNGANATVTFAEDQLTKFGYPTRNQNDEVSMINHKVKMSDAQGNIIIYTIAQHYPDHHLGLIVCILGGFVYESKNKTSNS